MKILNEQTELVAVERLTEHPLNPRKGDMTAIQESIHENGFYGVVIVQRSTGYILVGSHRYRAAIREGATHVPAIYIDVDNDRALRIMLADNRTNDRSGYHDDRLIALLQDLRVTTDKLVGTGYDNDALVELLQANERRLADERAAATSQAADESAIEVPDVPVTHRGDLWRLGQHRLLCGDCRDSGHVARLFGATKANLVVTSPPYASQRAYDPTSGFEAIPPRQYNGWFRNVAANVEKVLVSDGSYLLNIKEHADDGERDLYVKDLVLIHRRQWGWRFVDEFCWRKTNDGVPGGWPNRFKNAWEPVFHFCRQSDIKFRPRSVGLLSDACFDYSPNNAKANSGSGLLGKKVHGDASNREGIALPSNVIEVKTESTQSAHSAPFPSGLVEFLMKAFTDTRDVVYDPFLGSGTTLVVAEALGRAGYGCEISTGYCDVIIKRWEKLTGKEATLDGDGRSFAQMASERFLIKLGAQDILKEDVLVRQPDPPPPEAA